MNRLPGHKPQKDRFFHDVAQTETTTRKDHLWRLTCMSQDKTQRFKQACSYAQSSNLGCTTCRLVSYRYTLKETNNKDSAQTLCTDAQAQPLVCVFVQIIALKQVFSWCSSKESSHRKTCLCGVCDQVSLKPACLAAEAELHVESWNFVRSNYRY